MIVVLKPYKVTIDVITASRFGGRQFYCKRLHQQTICYVRAHNKKEAFFAAIHNIENSGIQPYHIITKIKIRRCIAKSINIVIH